MPPHDANFASFRLRSRDNRPADFLAVAAREMEAWHCGGRRKRRDFVFGAAIADSAGRLLFPGAGPVRPNAAIHGALRRSCQRPFVQLLPRTAAMGGKAKVCFRAGARR